MLNQIVEGVLFLWHSGCDCDQGAVLLLCTLAEQRDRVGLGLVDEAVVELVDDYNGILVDMIIGLFEGDAPMELHAVIVQ